MAREVGGEEDGEDGEEEEEGGEGEGEGIGAVSSLVQMR